MAPKPSTQGSAPKKKKGKPVEPPGPKPTTSGAGPSSQYTVTQDEEIVALQSIYGDDYTEHQAVNKAWQKSEPSFDIRVRALSDPDLSVTLSVVFTATYPKSAPLLSLKDDGSLREATMFKLQRFIEAKPKSLVAQGQSEPMIYDLVQGLQEILEDTASAKAQGLKLPSLEEERAAHEAQLAREAQAQKEEDERRKQEAQKEEERVMAEMVQQEVDRQRYKAKESRRKLRRESIPEVDNSDSPSAWAADKVQFDQACEVTDPAGNVLRFNAVTGRAVLREGPITTTYRVWPNLPRGRDFPSLALKETVLRASSKDAAQVKRQVQEGLERQLEVAKSIHHSNILEVMNYRIDREPSDEDPGSLCWTARVLTPHAERGSLKEFLDIAGQVNLTKLRSWTTDLLNALGHLHTLGILHKDIHPNNVFICRETDGEIIPKLADASFQREMHAICRKSRALTSVNGARSSYWLPPEIAEQPHPTFTQKTDVWDLGVVFLQMVFGLDILQKFKSPADLVNTLSLSSSLDELVSRFFKLDPKKRPRAHELVSSEFLATDAPIIEESSASNPFQPMSSLPAFRSRKNSTVRPATSSRYKEDFVELSRLGKGGFGEVVKARNKLDGQVYAIKKITQRSKESLSEILKEVQLLSNLNHPSVVRYTHTWMEYVDAEGESVGVHPDDGDDSAQDSQTDTSPGTEVQVTASTGGLDIMSSSRMGARSDDSDSDESDSEGWESDGNNGTDAEGEDDENNDGVTIVFDSEENNEASAGAEDGENGGGNAVEENDAYSGSTEEEQHRDDEHGSDDGGDGSEHVVAQLEKTRSNVPSVRGILYICMEYCKEGTMRDLIQRGKLSEDEDEVWRLFHQILDGLVRIHGSNIVHRDLKPENLFLSRGPDGVTNVKIGDFGLATRGHSAGGKATGSNFESPEEERGIGTSFYVAPEVRREGDGSYTSKVDMYSLGVIFFEMCYPLETGMERVFILDKLTKSCTLPDEFRHGHTQQADIVLTLVTHDVTKRPTSGELYQSGKLPIQMENEITRRVLASLTDRNSPYYPKVVSKLFAVASEPAKDYTWETALPAPQATEFLYQGIVKDGLTSIFRHHGAVETPRSFLYPRTSHYAAKTDLVPLVSSDGIVVQLPYDLMLGNARTLARQIGPAKIRRSYTFGSVYRHKESGRQPTAHLEVDFDIISNDSLDLAMREAEAIKVLEEVVDKFPFKTPMCFHLGHSDLLQLIFELCNVGVSSRAAAAEELSLLHFESNDPLKIRLRLRHPPLSLPPTVIQDLMRFDFRDSPTQAFATLKSIFAGSHLAERLAATISQLKGVVEYTKRYGVTTKLYINPLSCHATDFFSGGTFFQCVYDRKCRDILAVGGRYDSLIQANRPKTGAQGNAPRAVGFSMAWEKIVNELPKVGSKPSPKKSVEEPQGIFNTKRCDVLVASFDAETLRTAGLELCATLWSHDISAEIARDSRTPEELSLRNRDESYSWIIIIKQDSLKIRTVDRNEPDLDIPMSQVVSWLKSALRDRGSRLHTTRHAENPASSAATAPGGNVIPNSEQEVRVLTAGTKSKKFNRRAVIEQAQAKAAGLLQGFIHGPIAAIETSDTTMEIIRRTALSDHEGWRRAEQSVDRNEKRYVKDLHEMLSGWRTAWETTDSPRHAFVYNFRTQNCMYYDLGV
ncbi:anticodon binding domain of tRNAs-domain-containing protein [Xylariomycetidae sp. FL0641]|nr:anticodon binding domain of tRNAs-domain-containing protein [Xylariomycetidae sp. FL0641]